MSVSSRPARQKYCKLIELGLLENALNYIHAGWELVDVQTEHYGLAQTIVVYTLGWLQSDGKPVHPPLRDDPCRYGPSQN